MKNSAQAYLNELIPGQVASIERLMFMRQSGSLGQSFIFAGGVGWGKLALAGAFARLILCEKEKFPEPCECSNCQRLKVNQHPDMHLFGEDESKRSVTISEIRELLNWMSLKSFEGRAKFAVLMGCERMTTEAANALLKLLEEPPPESYLLLLTHNPKRLLDTIRSRCSLIRLAPVTEEALIKQLETRGIEKEEAHYLVKKSSGSLQRACALHEEGDWEEGSAFLEKACQGKFKSFVAQWQKLDRTEVVGNIRRAEEILRDALYLSVGWSEREILFQNRKQDLLPLAREGALKLSRKIGYLLETERALRSNVNQKLALTRLEMLWDC